MNKVNNDVLEKGVTKSLLVENDYPYLASTLFGC